VRQQARDEDRRAAELNALSRVASAGSAHADEGRVVEEILAAVALENARLREADQTKSEFVSMLAHELRGPITTVMGFGQILERQWRELDDVKRDRFLGMVNKEVRRLSRLVNDLLDLSRIEAGTLRYDIAPMSLADLIESIVSVHSSLTAEHEFELDLPGDLPKVQGDADRIRQVLLNLLGNATRYSPKGESVTLAARATEDGRAVEVAVKDHGIGISAEDQQRLFFKFVDLPKPEGVQKGTGLGLYITKGIVEAHGGAIWLESSVGEGSTFFFTLPAAHDQASQ
jgi:signal transduction histidine kinase